MSNRIIIADDHPLMRAAVRTSVEAVWPDHDIVEVADAGAARSEIEQGNVELLTLDLHMPDSDSLAPLMELRKNFPAVPVVVISASESPKIIANAKDLGASAFISKTSTLQKMTEILGEVAKGELCFPEDALQKAVQENYAVSRLASLTPAQTKILRYLTEGLLNKQIAHEMGISEATVKAHITAIFRRLGVINRTQAVLIAKELSTQPEPIRSAN